MKDKLEISDEMIGATDGKTCSRVFADPFIRKTKKAEIRNFSKNSGKDKKDESAGDKM